MSASANSLKERTKTDFTKRSFLLAVCICVELSQAYVQDSNAVSEASTADLESERQSAIFGCRP